MAGPFTVRTKMRGDAKMRAAIKKGGETVLKRIAAAEYQEAQIEMTEAKKRTPVDTTKNAPHPGQLRASGAVSEPEMDGQNIVVTLSFGTDYAVHVHENPDAIHPVGQWKFLESVLSESRSSMAARIAARVGLGLKVKNA
jgi:hypothetical protein